MPNRIQEQLYGKMKMRGVLKLIMLLIWVQVGRGRLLHSLLDTEDREDYSESKLPEETRSAGGPEGRRRGADAGRSRRGAEDPCSLHSILLQVRELGLGYDSDEMVVFKYCRGSCPRLPSNHDMTLANLRMSGALPPAVPWYQTPCCRPTRHEDMAFLDNAHRWHKVEKLSASACSCVG